MPAKKKRTTQKRPSGGAARARARRAPAAAETATRSRPARPRPAVVTLRVDAGGEGLARVASSPRLPKLAAEWMYVMRNRCRWMGDDDSTQAILDRAVETCGELEIDADALGEIVRNDRRQLELEFSASDDDAFDAACCFPWEFVLSSATRQSGRSLPMVITRLLRSGSKAAQAKPGSQYVYVESAPGRVNDLYSFESERRRLRAATGREWTRLISPTAERLGLLVGKLRPRVVHFSGIDSHQAGQEIEGFYDGDDGEDSPLLAPGTRYPPDGAILRGVDLPEVPVAHGALAQLLARATPELVTLNAYYSAARTARDCVRAGARAAIGFLDAVDDELAEIFYYTLYQQWSAGGAHVAGIPSAFGRTWNELRQQDVNLFGTGIVLWLADSALAKGRERIFEEQPDQEEPERQRAKKTRERRAGSRTIDDVLQVAVDVSREINYSLLHNARPLVDTLTLYKLVDEPLEDVTVEVQLNAGDVQLPFRCTEPLLDQPQRSLADQVRIPLTAAMLRALRERVQSTVYVKVMWSGRTAIEQTYPTTLLPVDEWYDDTDNNPWLPSFVLPRDPAVPRIVGAARRHLVTLQDDSGASFDGYQSVENGDSSAVDDQVQALWTALVQDFELAYVNPPPAYSPRNQRLRTPSEVIGTSSGTCVDLALLLASCLEYVDIYPVVVLLAGHAFVGYWRSEGAHDAFCAIAKPATAGAPAHGLEVGFYAMESGTVPLVDRYGWRLGRQQYREILSYLRSDDVRFLEATGLCFGYSFADALEEGRGDIKSSGDFDSLLDITLARRAKVTPLPLIFDPAPRDGGR